MTLLEIKDITKDFGGLRALDNVRISFGKGIKMGLIGPNGAGKTTLFNIISGFLEPSGGGRVIFKGENITGLKPHQIAKKGIVRTFQSNLLYINQTVLENVSRGCLLKENTNSWKQLFSVTLERKDKETILNAARRILDYAELLSYEDRVVGSMPFGLQRKVGICLALATQPEVLLLDEPMTGLNAEEIVSALDLINRVAKQGINIVLVEHNVKVVMEYCDRVVVLSSGKKIAEGSPEEIVTNRDVIDAYLGTEEIL
jgi:branched-chain amino acid transport system ATP-binding protein